MIKVTKKILSLSLLASVLSACDHIGTTKVKNIVDLTPSLRSESSKLFVVDAPEKNPIVAPKLVSHKLSSYKIISSPCVAKGVMYSLNSRGEVIAFSLDKKSILWSSKTVAKSSSDNIFSQGAIACADGRLYIANGTRDLVIMDAKTGIEIMRKQFPDILRSKPALFNGNIVIVQTVSNQLFAYDTKEAAIIWGNEAGAEAMSSSQIMSPLIYNGSVLVSYSSGELIMFDAANGGVKWVNNLVDMDDISSSNIEGAFVLNRQPIIEDGYFYLSTSNGKVMKVSSLDGKVMWTKKAEDIQTMSSSGNSIFITTNGRQIAALSKNDGTIEWVGSLMSEKERGVKKIKPVLFQPPFVRKNGDEIIVDVAASNGHIYEFVQLKGKSLTAEPKIFDVKSKDIQYQWISCCDSILYLIAGGYLLF